MRRSGQTKGVHIIPLIITFFLLLSCSSLQHGKAQFFSKIERGPLLRAANLAYQEGDYKQAGMYFEQVLNSNQDDAIVAYNLACCYALQGDADQAALFLTHAFQNGFRGLEIFFKDKDFDPVRDDPSFAKTIRDIEKRFESIGTTQYVATHSLQPYRIRYPQNYDAQKSYPLLIGLHGRGGNAEGFIAQYDKLTDPQVIYVTPEGQYPLSTHMGPQWYRRSWSITIAGKEAWKTSDEMVSKYILKTIEQVSSNHRVSDVYLMGFSQGAVYAYTIGLQNPDKIKGVIGFSGYLMEPDGAHSILTTDDIEAGADLRLYIAHGVDDAAIDVKAARKLKTLFEAKGYDLTYTEFQGRHDIQTEIFNQAVDWMQL